MIIYELDTEERMNNICENMEYVTLIRNSLADNREEYRKFTRRLSIDFYALQTCCDTFERNLLIDIYTYAEQLVKNFYYQVVEKDRSENLYIRNFINKKISTDKFSPNVKYCEIEKNIKSELAPDFKFILKSEREEIKIYDELVKSRHTYAHSGRYVFTDDFQSVIYVEKYIELELKIIIEKGMDFRINYQNELKLLIESVKKISQKISNYKTNKHIELKKKIVQEIKKLRRDCKNFYLKYKDYSLSSDLVAKTRENIIEISNFDLRKTSIIFAGISKFNSDIDEECIYVK